MKANNARDIMIEITTNDAEILALAANSIDLPEIAKEMIAVRSGVIVEEGVIPRKKQFEAFINDERYSRLQEKDQRWQRDFRIECRELCRTHIKFNIISDFALIDDVLKTISFVITDFSNLSEKAIKQTYATWAFLIKTAANILWKKYTIDCFVLQYDSDFYAYEDRQWMYEPERSSCVQIKKVSTTFPIGNSLDALDKYTASSNRYAAKPIPYEYLSLEAKHLVDDLKNIDLHVRLSKDALSRMEQIYEYDKRRIRSYLKEDEELSLLKNKVDRFYSDFIQLYATIINSD